MIKLKIFAPPKDKHKRVLMSVIRDLYISCAEIAFDPLFGSVSNIDLLDHVLEKIAKYYNLIGETNYE